MKKPKHSGVLVLEHFDFENPGPGGIEPIIRAMAMSNSVNRWTLIGVSSDFLHVGKWRSFQCGSVELSFLPVLCLDKVNRRKKIFPDSLLYILSLLPICRKLRPSIIHAHRIEIALFATLIWPRTPVVVFIHNESQQLSRNPNSSSVWRLIPSIHTAVTYLALKRARRIVVFNEREYRKLRAKHTNVYRGFSWFNPDVFQPKSNLQESSMFVITWVGRLESEKDPVLFLEILQNLCQAGYEFKANMIGSGTLLKSLQDLSLNYNLERQLTFQGSIPQDSLASTLRTSTVLVQTSYYEGSPTSIIESLACGTPVVSTFPGDPDEVIINGVNGYRVMSRSVVDFREAILRSREISRSGIPSTVSHRSKTIVLSKLLTETTQLHSEEVLQRQTE